MRVLCAGRFASGSRDRSGRSIRVYGCKKVIGSDNMKEKTIMKEFVYSYPMKVYFGEGAARKAIAAELGRFGKTVRLAYGGGSIKKSGVYDEMRSLLTEAGKEIVDFSGIMPNPTYAKVQEGAAL